MIMHGLSRMAIDPRIHNVGTERVKRVKAFLARLVSRGNMSTVLGREITLRF